MKQNRTKTAIAEAFTELLAENSIERVTVKMITDAVGCSRKTFYYYFTDVYDLAQYICEQRCEEYLTNRTDASSMRDGFLTLVNFFNDDRHVIRNMFHGYGTEPLERFTLRMSMEYTRQFLASVPQAEHIPEDELENVVKMYAYMFFGILVDWLSGDSDSDYIPTLDAALRELPVLLDSIAANQND